MPRLQAGSLLTEQDKSTKSLLGYALQKKAVLYPHPRPTSVSTDRSPVGRPEGGISRRFMLCSLFRFPPSYKCNTSPLIPPLCSSFVVAVDIVAGLLMNMILSEARFAFVCKRVASNYYSQPTRVPRMLSSLPSAHLSS